MARVRLTVQGNLPDITLAHFLVFIRNALEVLHELDQALSGEPRGTLKWTLADLGPGSAYVEAESRVTKGDEDHAPAVGRHFTGGLTQIQAEGTTPPFFSVDSLRRCGTWSA